jgi:chaperonin GroES
MASRDSALTMITRLGSFAHYFALNVTLLFRGSKKLRTGMSVPLPISRPGSRIRRNDRKGVGSSTAQPAPYPVVRRCQVNRYQPLSNFILIERIDETMEVSPGGMVIPEIGQVKSNKGRVIAVGEGYIIGDKLVPIPLSEGDIVLFSKYGAEEVNLDGKDFLLLRYDEVKLKEKLIVS